MPSFVENYKSSKIMRVFMILIGIRLGSTKREQLLTDCCLIYMIGTVSIALFVENSDLFYSCKDLYALTYNAPCSLAVSFDFLNLIIFAYKRPELHELHRVADERFWKKDYEQADKVILDKCDRKSSIAMIIITILACTTMVHFMVGPQLDAIGTNSTERALPFRIVYDLPVLDTPYYELMYTVETIATISIGICTVAFCSYLYHTSIFISGQYKILQRKLESVCQMQLESEIIKSPYNLSNEMLAYEKLKECIKQHQLLIWYIDGLENAFCYVFLAAIVLFSVIFCFIGFQFVLGTEVVAFHRQVLNAEFGITGTLELGFFAFACNEILDVSVTIGQAVYGCKWYNLPCDETGRAVRQGISIMVMRSYKPCTITVGKFCPMTVKVASSILSTAVSYLAVLRSRTDK